MNETKQQELLGILTDIIYEIPMEAKFEGLLVKLVKAASLVSPEVRKQVLQNSVLSQ